MAAALTADLRVDDWRLMFDAVKERLRCAAGRLADPESTAGGAQACVAAAHVVLDCVDALEQLQALLELERQGRVMDSVGS